LKTPAGPQVGQHRLTEGSSDGAGGDDVKALPQGRNEPRDELNAHSAVERDARVAGDKIQPSGTLGAEGRLQFALGGLGEVQVGQVGCAAGNVDLEDRGIGECAKSAGAFGDATRSSQATASMKIARPSKLN
jgi:hypothetical protein